MMLFIEIERMHQLNADANDDADDFKTQVEELEKVIETLHERADVILASFQLK